VYFFILQETAAHQLELIQSLSNVLQDMANPHILERSPETDETRSEDDANPPIPQRDHIVLSSFKQAKQNIEKAAHQTSHEDAVNDKVFARMYQEKELFRYFHNISLSMEERESEGTDCLHDGRCYSKTTLESPIVLRKLIAALRWDGTW